LAKNVGVAVAAVVVEKIVEKIIISVASKSTVSACVLTAGVTVAGPSLGVSFAVAVVADFAITYAVDWCLDPVGNLEKEICSELTESHRQIVSGAAGSEGLQSKFQNIVDQRVRQQRQAVTQWYATQKMVP